jgi:hypothetical protein
MTSIHQHRCALALPHRRASTWAALTATTALSCALLAACGGGGPTAGALAGKTPTQILTISIKAYHRQASVHFATKTVSQSPSQTTIEVGAASSSAASESLRQGSQSALDAILVDQTAYVRAGNAFLEGALQLSAKTAAAYAGKWISFHKGDPGYPSIAANLSPGAAIVEFVPEEPHLRVAGVAQFGGHTAVVVSGGPGRPPANGIASVSMFVSTTAPYLPLGATVVVSDGHGHTTERLAAVYGKWGEKVDPTPPSSAVPFTSIQGT